MQCVYWNHYWRGALHWGCIETIIQVLNPPFPPPTLVSAWFSSGSPSSITIIVLIITTTTTIIIIITNITISNFINLNFPVSSPAPVSATCMEQNQMYLNARITIIFIKNSQIDCCFANNIDERKNECKYPHTNTHKYTNTTAANTHYENDKLADKQAARAPYLNEVSPLLPPLLFSSTHNTMLRIQPRC